MMFRRVLVAAALSLGLAAPAIAAQPDYFAPRAGLEPDTALVVEAWSGRPDALARLRARLNENPAPANAYDGWSLLCSFEFHAAAHYKTALGDCAKAIALNPHGGDSNTLAIVKQIAHQPKPRAYGSARVPVSAGERVPVQSGSYDGKAIADTGAQISVMMQSVAKAAHVKMLGNSGDVGSTTSSVTGKIGLIPEVKIGHAVLKNIPVLVLPDSTLTLSDGKTTVSLPFIFSLYALSDFGRIAWLDHDKWLALGDEAPKAFPGAVPMIWFSSGIAVPLGGVGGYRSAQFDSGADVSYLYDGALPLVSDAERATMFKSKRKIGGVGALVVQEVRRFPQVNFTLAGQRLTFKNIAVAGPSPKGEVARLGEDVLQKYSAVVFDFGAMTFSVSP